MVQPHDGDGDRFDGRRSDEAPEVLACGEGTVASLVLSLSERAPDGDDATYLRWHLRDHLPEQYRLEGLRHGARFVSTPECRAARVAEADRYRSVDHVVSYLFAPPVRPTLAAWFELGAALRHAGRMPYALPSVEVGSFDVAATVAARRALVGAAVVPWHPATGILLVIERDGPGATSRVTGPGDLDDLAAVPGVVGVWATRGRSPGGMRLADTSGIEATIAYLDAAPAAVAEATGEILRRRWADDRREPLLAAPFRAVDPGDLDRHLP